MTKMGMSVRDGIVGLRPAGTGHGTGQLSVPAHIARAIPWGTQFRAEVVDDGILFRFVAPNGEKVAPEPGKASAGWRAVTRSPVAEFRKKPVVIAAMQWDGSRSSIEECCRWVNAGAEEPILSFIFTGADDVSDVQVFSLEGPHIVSPGDWIIKGVAGEFYACKPDIFAATYEPASATSECLSTRSPKEAA